MQFLNLFRPLVARDYGEAQVQRIRDASSLVADGPFQLILSLFGSNHQKRRNLDTMKSPLKRLFHRNEREMRRRDDLKMSAPKTRKVGVRVTYLSPHCRECNLSTRNNPSDDRSIQDLQDLGIQPTESSITMNQFQDCISRPARYMSERDEVEVACLAVGATVDRCIVDETDQCLMDDQEDLLNPCVCGGIDDERDDDETAAYERFGDSVNELTIVDDGNGFEERKEFNTTQSHVDSSSDEPSTAPQGCTFPYEVIILNDFFASSQDFVENTKKWVCSVDDVQGKGDTPLVCLPSSSSGADVSIAQERFQDFKSVHMCSSKESPTESSKEEASLDVTQKGSKSPPNRTYIWLRPFRVGRRRVDAKITPQEISNQSKSSQGKQILALECTSNTHTTTTDFAPLSEEISESASC